MNPAQTDWIGFVLLAIAILTFVQLKMSLSFGKRMGEMKALEVKMDGMKAQIADIKTNDLEHVNQDIRSLSLRVEGLHNAILHNMQETIRDVIQGLGCSAATCPYLADKNKESQG